jgi:hypothetical protein
MSAIGLVGLIVLCLGGLLIVAGVAAAYFFFMEREK